MRADGVSGAKFKFLTKFSLVFFMSLYRHHTHLPVEARVTIRRIKF